MAEARFHCHSCGKNLTMETRIRCAECESETCDLCLGCFCNANEPGAHSRHHKYQVFSNLHFPLFVPKWTAEEELLLLEAVTLFGFGNWADVGDHVGTKNEDECFEHYQQVYAASTESFPVPIGMSAPAQVCHSLPQCVRSLTHGVAALQARARDRVPRQAQEAAEEGAAVEPHQAGAGRLYAAAR